MRIATETDLEAIAETMSLALLDAPTWVWAFPDPERRLERHRALWRFELESALEYGWVFATEGCAAASLWFPPGTPEPRAGEEERFEAMLDRELGEDAGLVREIFARFERARPSEPPFFYLSLLATHPDHAHRGIGKALLAENLARIDELGAPAFLESTNPANLGRYERFGFAPHGEFELPGDGPSVAQMWREPA